jgi:phage-related protein
MARGWCILYFRESDGSQPAKEFYERELLPAEKGRFRVRIQLLAEKGLQLLLELSDILDRVERSDNLYELRLPNSQNNPRFLICALAGRRLVVLYGFKKKGRKLKPSDISVGERRRDIVVNHEEEY